MFGQQFQPPSNQFIGDGVVSTYTSPDSMLTNGLASQRALGPVTVDYNNPVLQYAPPEFAASIKYGEDDISDQSSNWQMGFAAAPLRMRSWLGWQFDKSFSLGSHVFNSLVKTSAGDDKISGATPAMLNILHLQRALLDARKAAGIDSQISDQDKIVDVMTAFSPADFAEKWGYVGACVEPSQLNGTTNEPMWGVTAPGKGVVSMANCFGENVKLGDEVYFIVRFEEVEQKLVANSHTPQPKQVLRIRGYAVAGQPARNSSKTMEPTEYDADSIQKGVEVARHWTETYYDITAMPGERFKKRVRIPLSAGEVTANRELVGEKLKFNMLRQGYVIRVGIVVEPPHATNNPSKELLEGSQYDNDKYMALPRIKVAPFVRRR